MAGDRQDTVQDQFANDVDRTSNWMADIHQQLSSKKLGYYHQVEAPVSFKYPQDVGEDVKSTINYNSHDSSEFAKKRLDEINKQSYEPFIFFEFLQVMTSAHWEEYKDAHWNFGRNWYKLERRRDLALTPEIYGDFNEATGTSEHMDTHIVPMMDAVKKDPNVFSRARRLYNGSIALYMPTDIAINDTVVYNEETRKAAASVSALSINPNDEFWTATTFTDETLLALGVAATSVLGKFLLTKGRDKPDPKDLNKLQAAWATFMSGPGHLAIAGIAGMGLGTILCPETQRHIGKLFNPHEYMAYKSTGMRNFTFTWKFLPDSIEESTQCREIIKHFRTAAHAERLDNLRLSVPDHVVTSFHGAGDMIQLPPTVIESTTVSYNPNAASFFRDNNNAPVEVDLSVTLKEIVPIYKEDVRDGY